LISYKSFHKVIKTIIEENHFNIEEYQDKYYFKKKVQEYFPNITDGLIFSAINSSNNLYYRLVKEKPLQKLSKELYAEVLKTDEGRIK
jgi:hypothetical protein